MELVYNRIGEVNKVCEKYHISLLYVFGSILTNKYNDESDIDFVVYFEDVPLLEYLKSASHGVNKLINSKLQQLFFTFN